MSVTLPEQDAVDKTQNQSRWKRYPEYKDSGVKWIGDIPSSWQVTSWKWVSGYISRGDSPQYVDTPGIPVINQACIQWSGLTLDNMKYQMESNMSIFKGRLMRGDLLVNSTGTGTLGRCQVFDLQGMFIADGHVTIIRIDNNKACSKFCAYLVGTQLYQGYIYSHLTFGSTNQIELSRDRFSSSPVILPPLPEQQAIADFLDRETAKIDALISKREKLIELLKEKRTAVISHAVTKGLDSNVPMKDSGVEWLGDIPEHWEVKRLKHLSSTTKGYAFKSDLFKETGTQVVKATDIKNESIRAGNSFIDASVSSDYGSVRLKTGDIILSTVGSTPDVVDSAVGQLAVVPEKFDGALLNQNTVRLELNSQSCVTSGFFFTLLRSNAFRKHLDIYAHGTANQASLNISDILSFSVVIPPSGEQLAILETINHILIQIDQIIARSRRHIDLLKEYRTSLISAAVTGKIDVRGEVECE